MQSPSILGLIRSSIQNRTITHAPKIASQTTQQQFVNNKNAKRVKTDRFPFQGCPHSLLGGRQAGYLVYYWKLARPRWGIGGYRGKSEDFPRNPGVVCEIWVFQAPGGIPEASWGRCGSYGALNTQNGATATHFTTNLMFFFCQIRLFWA